MKILGWEIIDSKKRKVEDLKALVPKEEDAGALALGSSMSSVFSFDQASSFVNDKELINKYRDLSFIPEVDHAIEEIINEMIVTSENTPVVSLVLDDLPHKEEFKNKIRNEFNYILNLLDFQNNAYDFCRRWYIDGRIFFHILIDMNKPKNGILDVRQLDAQTIKKVKEIERVPDENGVPIIKNVNEYFIYSENGSFSGTISDVRISCDSIAYSNSGLVDPKTGIILSPLHKAMKVANQLSMIESALIIYRLARAPERRVFYVDTGDLPKAKAEEYLKEQIARHRNKMIYDPSTGEIVDKKNVLSMMEDYWLPRRGGSRSTEIQTLEGGTNLANLEDVIYFREKLYKSLNVPISRLQPDATISYSKDSAIAREELKFARFIDKERKKFVNFLYDLLRKQLILKGIITPNDWYRIKSFIYIDFQRDSFYSELKNAEILSDRLTIINDANQYVGTLLSEEFLWKEILRFTDDQIEEIKEQNKKAKEKPEEDDSSSSMGEEDSFDTSGDSGDLFGLGSSPEEEPPLEDNSNTTLPPTTTETPSPPPTEKV